MYEFISVGVGGFIGSCARFALNKASARFVQAFPLGTLISNVVAGLLIGYIIGLEQNTGAINTKTKLFLTTGLLGGLSTFSTFSLETVMLFQAEKQALAAANVLLNLCLSLIFVVVGIALAEMTLGKA